VNNNASSLFTITTVTGQSVTGGLLLLACNWRSGDSADFYMIMTNVLQSDWLPSVRDDKLPDGTGLPSQENRMSPECLQ
jgi:hypothetical protein